MQEILTANYLLFIMIFVGCHLLKVEWRCINLKMQMMLVCNFINEDAIIYKSFEMLTVHYEFQKNLHFADLRSIL